MSDTALGNRRRGLGWKRDPPDPRDFVFALNKAKMPKLPSLVDLREKCTFPIFDQGQLGSCTACAIASAMMFERAKAGQRIPFTPSRLFIYFNERVELQTVAVDSGASLRVGLSTVKKLGACREESWPYSDAAPVDEGAPFAPDDKAGQRPPPSAFLEAENFQITRFLRLSRDLPMLRGCLAEGFPFVFGITLFKSMWDENDQPRTTVQLPGREGDAEEGGHAAMAVGYDDVRQLFIVRNSWGATVQDAGHFFLPYAYILDTALCADFWTVRAVES